MMASRAWLTSSDSGSRSRPGPNVSTNWGSLDSDTALCPPRSVITGSSRGPSCSMRVARASRRSSGSHFTGFIALNRRESGLEITARRPLRPRLCPVRSAPSSSGIVSGGDILDRVGGEIADIWLSMFRGNVQLIVHQKCPSPTWQSDQVELRCSTECSRGRQSEHRRCSFVWRAISVSPPPWRIRLSQPACPRLRCNSEAVAGWWPVGVYRHGIRQGRACG